MHKDRYSYDASYSGRQRDVAAPVTWTAPDISEDQSKC